MIAWQDNTLIWMYLDVVLHYLKLSSFNCPIIWNSWNRTLSIYKLASQTKKSLKRYIVATYSVSVNVTTSNVLKVSIPGKHVITWYWSSYFHIYQWHITRLANALTAKVVNWQIYSWLVRILWVDSFGHIGPPNSIYVLCIVKLQYVYIIKLKLEIKT